MITFKLQKNFYTLVTTVIVLAVKLVMANGFKAEAVVGLLR